MCRIPEIPALAVFAALLPASFIVGGAQAAPLVREVRLLPPKPGSQPRLIIPETRAQVVVDGRLDEAAWQGAAAVKRLVLCPSRDPDPRYARVLLLYDARNLYVGMELQGDDTANLELIEQKGPDAWGGHMAEMWLAPPGRDEEVYHLCLNARGTRYDETANRGASWHGGWTGKGWVGADRWSVEVAFPFKDAGLAGPPTVGVWLANFARIGERDASWTGAWENPQGFGRIYFGSDESERLGRPPRISLVLDREEYDPLHLTGVALAKIERGAYALSGLKVRMAVLGDGNRVIRKHDLAPLPGETLDLTLDVAGIPLGSYRVRAALVGPGNRDLASAECPLRKRVKRRQIAEPGRGSVALHVWPAPGNQRDTWPIATGVPFPQGALYAAEHVRLLDGRGVDVPCQATVRGRWSRHGSVRWLGLDFQGRLAQRGATYMLEYGRQVRRQKPARALRVSEDKAGFRVDTGPLQFLVRKQRFALLDEVRLGGALIVRQDTASGLELTDHEGNVYRAANDPDTRVAIEERGPLKVVLRAEGWYVKEGTTGARLSPALPTDRLCKHITRITAYAGKPYVAVQHVLVITYDTNKVRLRNVGMGIAVPGCRRATFGLDGRACAIPAALPASVRLYQPSSEMALVEAGPALAPQGWGGNGGPPRALFSGRRGDGWFQAAGSKGGVTVAVQDLWQLYPKELEVAGGKMWLHVWPRHGRPYTGVNPLAPEELYKLWWCHQGRELDFRMPEDVFRTLTESEFGKAAGCEENFRNGRVANAQGVAAETDFLVWFHPATATTRQAREINANVQLHPHACPDPQWTCDSLVFGRMSPKDDARFPDAERYFEHNVWARVAAQEYARDYGMWNYFDFHSDNSSFADGRWGLNRVWNNGHHGTARIPWYLYVRSGDPRYLQLGRRVARHVMNVDVVHFVTPGYDLFAGQPRPNWPNLDHTRGAMYHVKGFQHWGGDNAVAGHVISYDHLLWDYYLTGNHRALEVLREWVQGIKQLAPHGYSDREGTATIAELVEMYQATWDAGLLEILDAFQRRIASVPWAEQHWPNYAPFLERYLTFTGSQAYRKRALEWNDKSPNVAAALYYETKDAGRLKEILPTVSMDALQHDPDDRTVGPDTPLSAWYGISYAVQYWQPYLRALRDAGLGLAPGPRAVQWMPHGATLYLRKEKPGAVPLRLAWVARAPEPAEVVVIGPDGRQGLQRRLDPRDEPGEAVQEALPDDGATGIYQVRANLPDYRYGLRVPLCHLPGAYVIPEGGAARLFGPQVWYLRTGKEQSSLTLNVAMVGREGAFHVRTADGRKALACTTRPRVLKVEVRPDTVYSLASIQEGSNANIVGPVGQPLALAMHPKDLGWYRPQEGR